MRILVVDDEPDICEILQYNLETEGYEVTTANSAEEALELIKNYESRIKNLEGIDENNSQFTIHNFLPDLLLLDVMMGDISGFQLARKLKENPETANIPIIFITALDSEDDMVKGLNIGADDYIAKPLSMKEVKARVKAVLRRAGKQMIPKPREQEKPNNIIQYKDLVIDTERKSVEVDGEEIGITKIEFELLSLLVSHISKVFSREELLKRCWPSDTYVLDRTVDVNITRLRKKIGEYGKLIKTRFGYGYTFEE